MESRKEDLTMDEKQIPEEAGHNDFVRLPDAELEVMLAVWKCEPPVTTTRLMRLIDPDRQWKTPTLISFLQRLENRGFIASEKHGREYTYEPTVNRAYYVGELTKSFMKRIHGNSLSSFLNAAYGDSGFSDAEIEDLLFYLERRG